MVVVYPGPGIRRIDLFGKDVKLTDQAAVSVGPVEEYNFRGVTQTHTITAGFTPGYALNLVPTGYISYTSSGMGVHPAGTWGIPNLAESDDDYSYIYIDSVDGSTGDNLFKLSDPDASGTIQSVKVYLTLKAPADLLPVILLSTGDTVYSSAALASSADGYLTFSQGYALNPYTGAAWTWDEITALQAGFKLGAVVSGETAYFTCLLVVVDYAPVSTLAASDITTSGATLNGYLGELGPADIVYFEYGTVSGSLTSNTFEQSESRSEIGAFSAALTGLTSGTTYYYRAVVADGLMSYYGAEQSVTTDTEVSTTYSVTASVYNSKGGSVSPATQSVTAGNTAVVNIVRDSGYNLKSVTDAISGAAATDVTSSVVSAGSGVYSYTITGIAADHAVVVTFKKKSTGGGGSSSSTSTSSLNINLGGSSGSTTLDSDGEVQKELQVTSEDNNLSLTIPDGVVIKTKNGGTASSISIIRDYNPPSPAANNTIVLAYTCTPEGLTFSPALTLVWTYDPAALPAGTDESQLKVAFYNVTTGEWEYLTGTVDTVNHTITVNITHFSDYAILAPAAAAAAATPTPAVTSTLSATTQPAASTTAVVTATPTTAVTTTAVKPSTAATTAVQTAPATEPEKPSFNWTLLIVIIVVVVLIIVIAVIMRRKNKKQKQV